MIRGLGLAIAVAAFSVGTARAAPASFSVGGTAFTLTLPDGYCLAEPGSRGAQVAAALARADTQSQPDVMFFSCSEMQAGQPLDHFGSIKTPLATLAAPQTRAAVLAAYRAGLANGSLNAALANAHPDQQAAANVSRVSGQPVTMTGAPHFVATDAQAAYITGMLDINAPTRHVQRSVAGGVTVVKGRMFTFTLYAPYAAPDDITTLLGQAKTDIAHFIAENGG